MTAPDGAEPGGRLDLDALVRLDLAGTALFTVGAVGASVAPDVLQIPYAALSMLLFAVGIVAFLWAYAAAIGRSRYEYVSTAGVFFLTGGVLTGPPRVRLLACLAVQSVVAIAAASVQLYTPAAFGIMAPMFGLGLAGLAGARFGSFEARPDASAGPAGPDGEPDTTPRRGR